MGFQNQEQVRGSTSQDEHGQMKKWGGKRQTGKAGGIGYVHPQPGLLELHGERVWLLGALESFGSQPGAQQGATEGGGPLFFKVQESATRRGVRRPTSGAKKGRLQSGSSSPSCAEFLEALPSVHLRCGVYSKGRLHVECSCCQAFDEAMLALEARFQLGAQSTAKAQHRAEQRALQVCHSFRLPRLAQGQDAGCRNKATG